MTQKEYIEFQKKLPGKPPPCVVCHRLSYEHCRDKEHDCKAFRKYCEKKNGYFKTTDI